MTFHIFLSSGTLPEDSRTFTLADAYLFTVLGWMPGFAIDLGRWPNTVAYIKRVEARASMVAARERGRNTGRDLSGSLSRDS
ncbi:MULTISPECIES: glutathione binding-like protein [Alphaproteobacteria]|uniref:Glutathione S-transferase C-terminal domain-containing protein n=2 Tax=Alphaproteobacteria TaxID=28211 RepID=A0A512HNX3_9HYPH|nr:MULTISPECIES: glutathione binding-like protein [Alphaproteobacteria]GEO87154.1 hypothetical protein RNA01_40860 [Ciceribacter naphthalenivorans]GLR23266.1 hypothetical protein GCM10007920_30550 [Ciceribacter naphthalenivorans]GLT06122.1 hypothetical protein GCM10007926_30550 [Sphingomonas psychrolutea]